VTGTVDTTRDGPETRTRTRTRPRQPVDVGPDGSSDVTSSRAVRPPVVVRNRRLVADGFGEAFLVWRCLDCGAVGSLDAFPTRCVCGARRERLGYEVED
jgi:hypothetical protein